VGTAMEINIEGNIGRGRLIDRKNKE